MEPLQYLDFELKIEREKRNRYTAQVLNSPGGEASISFKFPFSEVKLENLVLKLGRPRSSTRRIHSAEIEAACELGGQLFDTIFSGDVLACLKSSLDKASYQEEKTGLRLKLRLQEVPELANLPWEFLFDSSLDRFLAQSNQTPIVRYIEMPERIKPITVNLPLHILVMISSPSDYLRLDVGRERSRLEETLEPLTKAGNVRVKWLENPTLTDLLCCLREGEYHVFHFIGHGGFDKGREEGVLVLEDEQGRGWLAGAHRIGTIVHDHPSLRLAVLNSCEGARNSLTDPFAGVAAGLIRQGVPAVVAMQFEITDEAAITFAGEFYAALVQGFPVDAAVAEARKAIYIQPNDIEWGTPVLYMRSSDGTLFDIKAKPMEVAGRPLPVASVGVSPAMTSVSVGNTTQLTAMAKDAGGNPIGGRLVAWSSSNAIVAMVSSAGLVTGVKMGTATITATSEGQSGTATITVIPELVHPPPSFKDRLISAYTNKKTAIYEGHKIEMEFNPRKLNFNHDVFYDGEEVSSKFCTKRHLQKGLTHVFQVSEDGEEIRYEVTIKSRWFCGYWHEVRRNGELIFTDR